MNDILEKPIVCLSYFVVKQGCLDELVSLLHSLIDPTKNEPGCLQYELVQDIKDPMLLIMLEKFSSKQSLVDHENMFYIKKFVEQDMDRLCEKVYWHEAKEVHPSS